MTVKRGDIVLIDLPQVGKHIQSGYRPCVVVQNDKGNTFSPLTIVVPLTSVNKKITETHVCFISGGVLNTVLCEQILTVCKADVRKKVGTVPDNVMSTIDKKIKISLGV